MGKSAINGSFSIAMLVYRRVTIPNSPQVLGFFELLNNVLNIYPDEWKPPTVTFFPIFSDLPLRSFE
jgi:hypothetical protein